MFEIMRHSKFIDLHKATYADFVTFIHAKNYRGITTKRNVTIKKK